VWIAVIEKLLVQMDPGLYFFINQGTLSVDSIDDKEEMKVMEVNCRKLAKTFKQLIQLP
jgi:hypothetical protein